MTYFEQKVKDYERGALPQLVIRNKRVPHYPNTYSGMKRMSTKCITFHNTGIDGLPAWNSYHWIKSHFPDQYHKVSWFATIDHDASIWEHAEPDDLLWASGTYPQYYTELAVGEYNSRPYDYDIPIEYCTMPIDGKDFQISNDQLVSGALRGVQLSMQFGLKKPSKGGFRRHYDFAKNKKDCPKYLVDPENWDRYLWMADRFYSLF